LFREIDLMSTRASLLLLTAVIAAAVSSQASSISGGYRPERPYPVVLDSEGEPARPAALPARSSALPETTAATAATGGSEEGPDGMASVLMLVGFLGLIGANLVRWSGDASCKTERSVF
jgi:hypothetical protein